MFFKSHRILPFITRETFIGSAIPMRNRNNSVDVVEARGRVALLERLKDHFWTRWKNEFLFELRNSHRVKMKVSEGQTVVAGDTVVIENGLH